MVLPLSIKTILENSTTEFKEKGSRFIGQIYHAKTLKYGMLHLCTLIFIKFFKNIKTPLSLVLLGLGFVSHQLVLTVLAIR